MAAVNFCYINNTKGINSLFQLALSTEPQMSSPYYSMYPLLSDKLLSLLYRVNDPSMATTKDKNESFLTTDYQSLIIGKSILPSTQCVGI